MQFVTITYSQVSVTYSSEQKGLTISEDKNIPITRRLEVGDKVTITEDSVLLSYIFSKLSIKHEFVVVATDTMSERSFTIPSGEPGITINAPDKIVYKNGIWQSYRGSEIKIHENFSFDFSPLEETKNILGYTCIKYFAVNRSNNKQYHIWASSALPKTLLPFIGLNEFPAGILALEEITGNLKVQATSIK